MSTAIVPSIGQKSAGLARTAPEPSSVAPVLDAPDSRAAGSAYAF